MINKIKGLIFIILLFSFKLKAEKVDGTIKFKSGETINVVLNIPTKSIWNNDGVSRYVDIERMQVKVKYYDHNGKKIKVKPQDAKEVWFIRDDTEYRLIAVENTIGLGPLLNKRAYLFLELEVEGRLRLYRYYETRRRGGAGTTGYGGFGYSAPSYYSYQIQRPVFQKNGGEIFRPIGISFRKDMMKYLEDCPSLSQKIEDKDYRKSDVGSIVRYYNSNCGGW